MEKQRKYELAECVDCHEYFEQKSPRQIRCRKCQIAHDLEKIKSHNKRKREERIKEPKVRKKEFLSCKSTKTCIYGSHASYEYCNYFNVTGKLRGEDHPIKDGKCDLYQKGRRDRVRGKGHPPQQGTANTQEDGI